MGKLSEILFGKKPSTTLPSAASFDPATVAKQQGAANRAAANEQNAANLAAAQTTTTLNRPNQVTPFGSLTWSQGGGNFNQSGYDEAMKLWTDAGKQGQAPVKESFGYDPNAWTATTTLDPRVDSAVNAQFGMNEELSKVFTNALDANANSLGQAGSPIENPFNRKVLNTLESRVNARYSPVDTSNAVSAANTGRQAVLDQLSRVSGQSSQPFNYNSAPAMPQADAGVRQRVEDALYQRATSRLDPRFATAEDQLRTRLATQGITEGSEAARRELEQFGQMRNDAYSSAMNDSIAAGGDAMEQLFGMQMGARQQGIAEANTLRQMPLMELSAIADAGRGLDASAIDWEGTRIQNELAKDSSALSTVNAVGGVNDIALSGRDRLMQDRGQILQELLALRGMQGNVPMPEFQSGASGANVQTADFAADPIIEALLAKYGMDLDQYNARSGNRNARIGGATSLATSLIGAFGGRG